MRRNSCPVCRDPAHDIEITVGNRGGATRISHQPKYARRAQNLQFSFKIGAQKNVAGEKREGDHLRAVLPTVRRNVNRQEDLKALVRKRIGNSLFMLMLGVGGVPVAWS